MLTIIKKGFSRCFDFILPRFCIHCSKALSGDESYTCSFCHADISMPPNGLIHSEFNRKFAHKKFITEFGSAYLFEKDGVLQSMIHSLKYNQNFQLGFYLGKLAAIELRPLLVRWNAELLMPVPLHRLKQAERGYNQSYYIAKGIASLHHLKVNMHLLKRIRFTQSQTSLNLDEREANIAGAFFCKNKKPIQGKKIILVDDVITTGSTINEAAGELIKSGADKVYAISAGIADI